MIMRIQKFFSVVVCSISLIAVNASAAIINHVDFPDEFVKAKEKKQVVPQEQIMAAADAQN